MKLLPLLLPVLLFSNCRSVAPSSNAHVKSEVSSGVPYTKRLDSKDEFARLARPNNFSFPFVKFSHFYGLPTTDPLYDQIYFQNTNKYKFHVDFIHENLPQYKDFKETSWEELILPPKGDGSGASIKEVTAGAIYYRPEGSGLSEQLVYSIYFHTDISATGVAKTKIDVAEVARFDKKLKASVGFVQPTNIAFLIPEKADFFTYSSKLKAAGINAVKRWEFEKPITNSVTFVEATSYGYLRNISAAEFDAGNYSDRDILLFQQVPLDVGPISGVITAVPAAAHSHVIFRAQNLNVPGIYIPDALNVPSVSSNLGKLIKLKTSANGVYTIDNEQSLPSIQAEAEQYWQSRRKKLDTPVADLGPKVVKVWNKEGVNPEDIKTYGAKATNFAILDRALVENGKQRDRYSNGFMVPFSFFDIHMSTKISAKICDEAAKKCAADLGRSCAKPAAICAQKKDGTLRDFATAMLEPANKKLMNDEPMHRREFLGFIQRLIRETPLSPSILEPIRQAMSLYPPTVRMRLRSSTNAEDIAGLTGAGLYESKSACLGDDEKAKDSDGKPSACRTELEMRRMKQQADKLRTFPDPEGKLKRIADELIEDITKKYPLSKSIRSVYASLWTERAFLTREYYGLDHLGIYMGMLSHPSFVDETANGVAVVSFQNGEPAQIKLETQYDDISVTNPIFPDTLPEQWAADIKGDAVANARVVQQSTLSSAGKMVLTESEVAELTKQLAIAAKALRKVRGGDRYDLEFILGKDREVLVKQGRPL